MNTRVDKEGLFDRFRAWDGFLKKRVRLIACGGTALTLIGVKDSTKDVDLLIPDLQEYAYLIDVLKDIGYAPKTGSGWSREGDFIFDLFKGKTIHTTELLESPLDEENHILIKEFSRIYLGALNFYDIIISKLFRGTAVDIDDCLSLIRAKKQEINLEKLKARFEKTASFDISTEKVNKNLEHFLKILKKEGLYGKE